MSRFSVLYLRQAAFVWAIGSAVVGSANNDAIGQETSKRHVILISVDGMHALDLARFVEIHPNSTLSN